MAEFPAPAEGMLITYLVVSDDVERSRRFYSEVLGGEVVLGSPEFSIVALANGWVTITPGGGPTPDKPGITLEPPRDRNRASGFLNLRVADIAATFEQLTARGARFLTPPIDHGGEDSLLHARPGRTSHRNGASGDASLRTIQLAGIPIL